MKKPEYQIKVLKKQIKDGQSSRVTHDFLKRFADSLAKNSVSYFDAHKKSFKERDHPLRYIERQMYSLFSSALHDLTPLHLSEVSVERTPGSRNSVRDAGGGRADFYAYYRGTEIFMELKRVSVGIDNKGKSEKVNEAWKSIRDQVTGLGRHVRNWSERPARMGLLVVLPYKSKKGEIEANADAKWLGWEQVDRCSMVLKVHLPKRMWVCDSGGGRTEYVPAVYLLAYVRLPYKREG